MAYVERSSTTVTIIQCGTLGGRSDIGLDSMAFVASPSCSS
jgi:hypothetical protein